MHITYILVGAAVICLIMHLLCYFGTKATSFDAGYWAGATVALCLSASIVGLLT